ncbi:MAG TPA: glycosyltransferase family 39 protein [Polyangiaceae bacterium]|nr:glycosyltransferase family 39 protein [Polyangiaceae bacterium]
MKRAAVTLAHRALRSPLTCVAAVAFALRVVGLTWGLPASDGWDNDGIAPRDFLPGLIETFTPGHYFTYPPAHLALLSLLTLPLSLGIVAHATSLAPHDIIQEAIHVPYMTAFALVARVVSLLMSIGIVLSVAKIAQAAVSRRAGVYAGAMCAVNGMLTYYGHATNLDVPYLFWATLALLELVRAIDERAPRRLRAFALLAALSIASKDQAYALYVLSFPATLCAAALYQTAGRSDARAWAIEGARAAVIGIAAVLLLDGALVNPTGFVARLHYLVGPASQPFASYSADSAGRALVVADSLARFDRYYPLAFGALVALGVIRAARLPDRARRVGALVPLAAIVSFTVFFNCVARRTEDRFLLPQMVVWAVYGGIGVDWVLRIAHPLARFAFAAAFAGAFALAVFRCADVDVNLLLDPRYDAEAWLRAHVATNDTLEVHGKNVYLPRLPPGAAVARVGRDPLSTRNPLPGVVEVQAPLTEVVARAPRWIVVAQGWAGHILTDAHAIPDARGRIFAGTEVADHGDADALAMLRGLFDGHLGYATAHVSTWSSAWWPRVDIQGSVSPTVWIFERRPP